MLVFSCCLHTVLMQWTIHNSLCVTVKVSQLHVTVKTWRLADSSNTFWKTASHQLTEGRSWKFYAFSGEDKSHQCTRPVTTPAPLKCVPCSRLSASQQNHKANQRPHAASFDVFIMDDSFIYSMPISGVRNSGKRFSSVVWCTKPNVRKLLGNIFSFTK